MRKIIFMDTENSYIKIAIKEIGESYSRLRLVYPKAEKAMERSIRKYGQISPVVVGQPEGSRYEMVDGFKRLRACKKLGQEWLSGKVLAGKGRALKSAILYLNMKVRSIDDLEQGMIIQSFYRQDGLNQVEIAKLLDRDKSWVSRRLSLVERLCEEVIEQMRLGLVSSSMGRELARLPRGNQSQALQTLQKYHFTVRETARLVSLLLSEPSWNQESILSFPEVILSERQPTRPPKAPVDRLPRFYADLASIDRLCARCIKICNEMIIPHTEECTKILASIEKIEAVLKEIRQQFVI
jgi:ParB/RepB/Spo0J family partition protein